MKALLLALLLWQAADATQPAPAPEPRFQPYQRAITPPAPQTGSSAEQACAILDAPVYAHAAPTLKDLRLYQGEAVIPYAITLSEPAEPDSEPAQVTNLGMRGRQIVFDLAMPARPYTDVTLSLDAHDFIASATVAGANSPSDSATQLGTFTLFDLTAQHLSRSTTLHLQESSFRTLHIALDVSPAPGAPARVATPAIVQGAVVPPSREAQSLYTTVAETTSVRQQDHQTIATFRLPAHVPVERIAVAIAPGFAGNFSRPLAIVAHADDAPATAVETLNGSIQRVRMTQAGREIRQQQLSVPATIGANLQTDATVEVRIDNGDDTPVPLAAVSLEMRRRKLCFTVPAAPALNLYYGDSALLAPSYDYGRLLSLSGSIATAQLGPEQHNPSYTGRPVPLKPLTERHPELLWIALLAVVCILAVVAIHSSRRIPK